MSDNENEPTSPLSKSKVKSKPQFELNWLLFSIKDLEPISLIIGLVVGVVITLGAFKLYAPIFINLFGNADVETTSKEYIRLYEKNTNKPKTLEGSHYTLKPNKEYKIELVNVFGSRQIIWEMLPQDFGKLDYDPSLSSPNGKVATYVTPQVADGSSGLIKLCELDDNNLCRGLNLPEIQVVISSK